MSIHRAIGAAALATPLLIVLLPSAAFAQPGARTRVQAAVAVPQQGPAPTVRAIGVLRSANRRQSRAILQVNGGAPADYAEGNALAGGWKVQRIDGDAVAITDGARSIRVPVSGGDAHPAERTAATIATTPATPTPAMTAITATTVPSPGMTAAPQVLPIPSKAILEDAARRRAIHFRRAE